ncbi:MAG: hypothetical protein ACKVVT_00290 [Dehalococcoidia bacterium]
MTTRESAHALIEALPEGSLAAALAALAGVMRESYPIEDEDLSPKEHASLRRALADVAAGRIHSDEDVDRMLNAAASRSRA